jgi:hypothetical protein
LLFVSAFPVPLEDAPPLAVSAVPVPPALGVDTGACELEFPAELVGGVLGPDWPVVSEVSVVSFDDVPLAAITPWQYVVVEATVPPWALIRAAKGGTASL